MHVHQRNLHVTFQSVLRKFLYNLSSHFYPLGRGEVFDALIVRLTKDVPVSRSGHVSDVTGTAGPADQAGPATSPSQKLRDGRDYPTGNPQPAERPHLQLLTLPRTPLFYPMAKPHHRVCRICMSSNFYLIE